MAKRRKASRRIRPEHLLCFQLRHLVGCAIESLQSYVSDDGHNELVLAGLTAELRRLELDYDRIYGRATRRKSK